MARQVANNKRNTESGQIYITFRNFNFTCSAQRSQDLISKETACSGVHLRRMRLTLIWGLNCEGPLGDDDGGGGALEVHLKALSEALPGKTES